MIIALTLVYERKRQFRSRSRCNFGSRFLCTETESYSSSYSRRCPKPRMSSKKHWCSVSIMYSREHLNRMST